MPESGWFALLPTPLGPRVVRLDEGGVVTGRGAIRALIERELAALAARDPSLEPRDLAHLRRQLMRALQEAFSGRVGSEREFEWVSRVFWGWTPALPSPENVLARLTRPALTPTQRSLSVAELRWLLSRLDLPEGSLVRLVPYRKTLVAALLTPKGQVIPLAVASGRRWQWIRTPFASSSWAKGPVQIALQRAVSRAGMDFPPAAALGQLVARLSAQSVPDVGSALSESEQKTVSDFVRRVGDLLSSGEHTPEAYRALIASIPEEMSAESIQAIAAGVRELREQIQEQAITPIEQAQGHLRQMAGALRESVVELAEARAMLGEAQAHMSRLYAALPSWMTLSDVAAMVPANLLERLEQATTLSPELASELASFLSEQAQALSRSEYTRAVWGTQEVLTDLLSRLDELRAMAYQQGVQVSQTAAERDAERTARFREVVEESVSAWAREVRLQQAYQDVLEQASRGYREIGVPVAPVDVERALMGIAAYDRPVTVRVGQREIEYRPPGLDVTEDVWQRLEQAQREGRLVRRSSDELVYRIREVRRGEGVVLEPLSVPAHALRPRLQQALQAVRSGVEAAQAVVPEVSEEWLQALRDLSRPVIPLSWGAQGSPERLLVDVESLRAALGTQEPSQLVDVAAIFRSAGLEVPVDETMRVPRIIWETVATSAPWSVFGRDWDEVKDAVQNMALAFSEALHDLGGMELEASRALAEQLHSRIMGRFLRRHIQGGIETAGLGEAERGMYIAVQQMLQEYAKTTGIDPTQMADRDILAARERLLRAYQTFGGDLGYLSPIVDRRRLTDPMLLRIARDLQARMAVQTVHLETPTVGYRVGEVDERLQALWETYEMAPPHPIMEGEVAIEELLRDVESGEVIASEVVAPSSPSRMAVQLEGLQEALRRLPFPEAEPIVRQLHARLSALENRERNLASLILERLVQRDPSLHQDQARAQALVARYTDRALRDLDRARRQAVRDAVSQLEQVGVGSVRALSVVQALAGSDALRKAYTSEELRRMLGAFLPAMSAQQVMDLMEGLSAVGVETIPVDVEFETGPVRGQLTRLSGGDVVVRLPGGPTLGLEGLVRPLSVPAEAVLSIRSDAPMAFEESTATVWGRRVAPFLESVAWDPESLLRPSRLRPAVIPHDPGISLQNLQAFVERQAPGLLLDIETTTLPARLPVDDRGRPIREAMALTSIQYEPVRWDPLGRRLVRGERVERLVRLPEATRRYVEQLLARSELSEAEIAVLANIAKFADRSILDVELLALEDPSARSAFLQRLRSAARSGLEQLEAQGIDPIQALWEYRRAAAGRIVIGLNVTGFDIPVLEGLLRESLQQDLGTWRRLLRRQFREIIAELPSEQQRVLMRLWKQVESQGLSESAFEQARQALRRAREAGFSETAFRKLSRLFRLYEERPAIEMRFLPSWARVSVPDRRLETLVGYLFGAESEVFRAYRETAHVSDLPATGAVFEALTRRVSGMAFPQPLEAGHWVGVVRAIGGRYDRPQVTRGAYRIERIGRERLPLFGERPAYRVELAPLGGGPAVVLRTTTHQELQYLLARHTVRLADEAQAQAFADYLASDDLRRAFERASWSARSMRFYLARDVVGTGQPPEEALAARVAALQAEWEQGRRLSERPLSPTEQALVESYRMLGGEAGVRRARIARAREVPARQLRWRRALSQVLAGGPTREAILPFLEEVEALQASGLWSSSQARRATRRFLDRIKQFAARRPVPHLADLGTLVTTLGNRAIEIPMVVDTLNEAQALGALRRAAFRIYRQARELGIGMPFAEAAAQVLGHLRRQNLAASTLEEAASVLVAASRAGRLRSATVEDWSRGILGDLSEDVTEEQIRRRVAEVQAIGREVRSEMMREQREAWRTYRQQMSEALASQGAEMAFPEPPRDVAPVGGVMEAARFRMARQIQRDLTENPELAAAVRLYAPSGRPYLQPDVRGELVSIPDWYRASGEQMSRLEDLGARMEQTRRSVQELQRAIDEAVRNRSGDVGDLRRRLQETWQTQRQTLRELERLAAYAGDPVRRRAQELLGWAEEQGLEQTLITRGEFAGWRLGELTARRDWEAVRSRLAQAASAWQSWRVTSPLGGRLARFLSEPAPVASVGIEAAPAVSRTASTSARRAASPRPGALSQAARAAPSPARQATREQIDRIFEASVHRSRSALRRWYEERGAPWLPWVGGLALAGWAFRQMTRKDLVVSEPAWQRERMPQVPAQVEVYPAPETRPRRGLSIRLRARSEGQVDESRLQPILEQSLKNALGIPVRAHVQLQDDRSRLTQEWVDGVVSQLIEEGYVSHA